MKSLKFPLDSSINTVSLFYRRNAVAPAALWMGWSQTLPTTLFQAHENSGGNYTDSTVGLSLLGIYEDNATKNQGFSNIMFNVAGASPVVSLTVGLYSFFTRYNGNGSIVSTIPLASLRNGVRHDFAMLIENKYDTSSHLSGIHARIWHRGAPTGTVWTLMTELVLTPTDVNPDAFEAWRYFGIESYVQNVTVFDATADYINFGNFKIADAAINSDPYVIGVTADPSCLNGPDTCAVNIAGDIAMASASIDGDVTIPLAFTRLNNRFGVNLQPFTTFYQDFTVGITPPIAIFAPYSNRFSPMMTGSATLYVAYASGSFTGSVLCQNQTGHIGDDFTSYSSSAQFSDTYQQFTLASRRAGSVTQLTITGSRMVDGHQAMALDRSGNATSGVFLMEPDPPGTDGYGYCNDIWFRVRAAFDVEFDDVLFTGNLLKITISVGSGNNDFSLILGAGPSVSNGTAQVLDPAFNFSPIPTLTFIDSSGSVPRMGGGTVREYVLHGTLDQIALTGTVHVYYEGALIYSAPTFPLDNSSARWLSGNVRLSYADTTHSPRAVRVSEVDVWRGEINGNPLGLL